MLKVKKTNVLRDNVQLTTNTCTNYHRTPDHYSRFVFHSALTSDEKHLVHISFSMSLLLVYKVEFE